MVMKTACSCDRAGTATPRSGRVMPTKVNPPAGTPPVTAAGCQAPPAAE
jgi:hypothetical protein